MITDRLWALMMVGISFDCLLNTAEATCADIVSEWNFASFAGKNTYGHRRWQVPVSTWVNPNMTEDWDKGIIDNQNVLFLHSELCLDQRNDT